MGDDFEPAQFVGQQLHGPLLTSLRRRAATERHQSGFGTTVQHPGGSAIRPQLPPERCLQALLGELRPDPLDLPPRHPDQSGNLLIRLPAVRLVLIAQQQDSSPFDRQCRRGLCPSLPLKLFPLRVSQLHHPLPMLFPMPPSLNVSSFYVRRTDSHEMRHLPLGRLLVCGDEQGRLRASQDAQRLNKLVVKRSQVGIGDARSGQGVVQLRDLVRGQPGIGGSVMLQTAALREGRPL